MPTVEWNRNDWQNRYAWPYGGEDWSQTWGGSAAQWHGAIFPRIAPFLPAASILEIAPGFGRMTRFLLPWAQKSYRAVDIAERCTQKCREIFSGSHPDFKAFTNDGLSLECVGGHRYDFIFSFDSLVHASEEVIESYIKAILGGLLNDGGAAFIHHSNLKGADEEKMNIGRTHKRDETIAAREVFELIEASGGRVLRQEIIAWGGEFPKQPENACIDAFTLFCNKGDARFSQTAAPNLVLNPDFMKEALYINKIFSPYYKLQDTV